MRKLFLLSSILLLAFSGQAAGGLYEQTIFVEKNDDPIVQQSLADLKAYLGKITGKEYQIKEYAANVKKGILVVWSRAGLVNEKIREQLVNGSIEGFVLSGDNDRLVIMATHPLGFSRAIYSYLDELCVKWYFPGEQWEYVPQGKDIRYKKSVYEHPSFMLRDFFGTGGIRDIPVLDPKGVVKQAWADWRRRNRMGGEINPGGHYGEVFNLKYREILEQHPQYLAYIKGSRQTWNIAGKWCISNKDFRDLFIKDRIEDLKLALRSRPNPNEKILISVDPADGGGDCECDACRKMGSPSDNTFFLANEVAKALAKISPRAIVNLYAYNTHADTPPFPLAPNLMVQVIPYAFHNIGTPEEMLEKWKQHHSNLLLYDYYAIPDWHYEFPMPRKISPDTLVKRIRYWHQQGVKGFTLESDYGFGNAGIGLYLMSRMGWDLSSDPDKIRDEFYSKMFGSAATIMKQYYAYQGNKYEGVSDLPHLLDLLDQADKKADETTRDRLVQLKAYIHYMYLFQRWLSATPEQKQKTWEEANRFVWQIYPMMVIHSTRIADLLYYNLDKSSPFIKDWSIVEPFGEKLKSTRFISAKEIVKLSENDEKTYPLLEDFVFGKQKILNYQLKKESSYTQGNSVDLLFLNFPDSYIKAGPSGSFIFSLRLNGAPSKGILNYDVTITCVDTTSGKTILSRKEKIGYEWKQVSLKLPAGKAYRLSLRYEPWLLVRIPNDQFIAFSSIPTYALMEKLWFYIPAGTKYFYYSNTAKDQPVFTDPKGQGVIPQAVNDLNMFRLDMKNKSGQWWSMGSAQYKFLQFYSRPDLFFTHPGYTVQSN